MGDNFTVIIQDASIIAVAPQFTNAKLGSLRADEVSYVLDETKSRLLVHFIARRQETFGEEMRPQFAFIIRHVDSLSFLELRTGRKLMVVTMFTQRRAARKEDNGLFVFLCDEKRADAGMRNDDAGISDFLFELGGSYSPAICKVNGNMAPIANLAKNLLVELSSYSIDGPDKAIERQLHSDGEKNHRTLPK
jgi:hypothetical protein